MNSTAIISVSGGLDSTTLLHYIVGQGEKPIAVMFDYGQRHDKECGCAVEQCSKLEVPWMFIQLDEYQDIASRMSALVNPLIAVPTVQEAMGDPQPVSYVPNRNVLF